jgi:uncharacterized membrane-anchored protein YhcB (DUF1043 family)
VSDVLDRTARQVRSLTRNPKAVHRHIATTATTADGDRWYRTACHKELLAEQATLTTADPTCRDCQDAT